MKSIRIFHPDAHILHVDTYLSFEKDTIYISAEFEDASQDFEFKIKDADKIVNWQDNEYLNIEEAISIEFEDEIIEEIGQWAIGIFDRPVEDDRPMSDEEFYKQRI